MLRIPSPYANSFVIGTVVTTATPRSSKIGETIPASSTGSFAQEVTVEREAESDVDCGVRWFSIQSGTDRLFEWCRAGRGWTSRRGCQPPGIRMCVWTHRGGGNGTGLR